VFILSASRSGSTLLRFILDSHPELACPPETSIASMCAQVVRSWSIAETAGDESTSLTAAVPPPPEALAATREIVDRMFGRYLARRGKARWCDKSLDSFMHAELLLQIYPEAKFLCLYRHCMDVIASGVEACPWGLTRFGFDAFAAQSPGNSVAAIGGYWLHCAQGMMPFEERHPESCHRVRYEDMVTRPEEVTAEILKFLGCEQAPGITQACFDTAHEGNGPGDEKLWFTTKVDSNSMGRGVSVPAAALPGPLRGMINEALAKLGYRKVDPEWNAAVGPFDPRADNGAGAEEGAANGDRARAGGKVKAAISSISDRLGSWPEVELSEVAAGWPALAGQTIEIVAQDGAEHARLRWTFPAQPDAGPPKRICHSDRADGGEPAAVFIADPDTWHSLQEGATNVVTEIGAGKLRCVNRRDGHRIRSDELHALAMLLGISRIPVARTAGLGPRDDQTVPG
jgi:hypothetical protein